MDFQIFHRLSGVSGTSRRPSDDTSGNDSGPSRSSFPRSTNNTRRNGTGEKEDFQAENNIMEDNVAPSNDSIHSSDIPWDEHSDGDGSRGAQRRDARKTTNASTPPLVDEAEEDLGEEAAIKAASLERERILQNANVLFQHDTSKLRRTPGAPMFESAFRQDSSEVPDSSVDQKDASGLGFGLTLSTPVVRGQRKGSFESWEDHYGVNGGVRQERSPIGRSHHIVPESKSYSKGWTPSKNTGFENRVCSPNTLRMNDYVGNLLSEADDEPELIDDSFISISGSRSSGHPKGPPGFDVRNGSFEEWTAPYVESRRGKGKNDKGIAGRFRRSKMESGSRREKSYDRPSRRTENRGDSRQMSGFLPFSTQNESTPNYNHHNNSGSVDSNPPREERGDGLKESILNFCGAFVPDAKSYTDFLRPIPSVAAALVPTLPSVAPETNSHINDGFHEMGTSMPPQVSFLSAPQEGFANHSPFAPQTHQSNLSAPINPTVPTFGFIPTPQQGFVGANFNAVAQQSEQQGFIPVHPYHQTTPVHNSAPPHGWHQPHMVQPHSGVPFGGQGHVENGTWHVPPFNSWQMNPSAGFGMIPNFHDPAQYPKQQSQSFGGQPCVETHQKSFSPGPYVNPFAPGSQQSQTQNLEAKHSRNTGRPKNKRNRGRKKDRKNCGDKKKVNNRNKRNVGKESSPQTKSTAKLETEVASVASTSSSIGEKEKKEELVETPETQTAFKNFQQEFRNKEQISYIAAKEFAMQTIGDTSYPSSIHWKVYLELAVLSKRANKFREARELHQKVYQLQPYAHNGWVEYSKLEEECGNMAECSRILRAGLNFCKSSDNLLIRAIKHEERMGNLDGARAVLSGLRHQCFEKVFKALLEGALLEARAGNHDKARRVLKYIMHHRSWYGPVFLEAYKLEKDLGRTLEALAVVNQGLESSPRYGPLWFAAFKLCEELDIKEKQFDLPRTMEMVSRATGVLSKELIWKVHRDAAFVLQHIALDHLDETTSPSSSETLEKCRKRFAVTVLTCPSNLKWKVWLAAGRMEVYAGNYDTARSLFKRALAVVPEKGIAVALLECARVEEFVGETEVARAILTKSRSVSRGDWKVWSESMLLELRNNNFGRAIELAELGLKLHNGTGRLWATLVQLCHFEEGERAQLESLKMALNAVPKSGEVWCEGARIHLNPFSRSFDPKAARRHLLFATKFTPQFGDGFLELMRQEILEQWLEPVARRIWESSRHHLVLNPDGNGLKELEKYVFEVSRDLFLIRVESDGSNEIKCVDEETVSFVRDRLEISSDEIDTSSLQLQCANADPNYGSMWFHCQNGANDTARKILSIAVDLIFNDLKVHAPLYLAAFVRRWSILFAAEKLAAESRDVYTEENNSAESAALKEQRVHETLLAAPSLEEMVMKGGGKNTIEEAMDLLESSTRTSSDFVSGLVVLNKDHPLEEMTLQERRKALYGTDALFS